MLKTKYILPLILILLLTFTLTGFCWLIEPTPTQTTDVFSDGQEDRPAVWYPTTNVAYMFGGQDESNVIFDDVLKWTPGSNPTHVADLDETVKASGAVYDSNEGKCYIYGGLKIASPVACTDKIFWFDPSDDTEGTCTETLANGMQQTLAVYDSTDHVTYIFGGYVKDEEPIIFYDKIWKHDPDAGTVTEVSGQTLTTGACTITGQYVPSEDAIYTFGGHYNDGTDKTVNEIHKFDCSNDTISKLSAICPDYAEGIASYYNPDTGLIYLYGGCDRRGGQFYKDTVWAFDPSDESVIVFGTTIINAQDDFYGVYDTNNNMGYLIGTQPSGAGDNEVVNQKYICRCLFVSRYDKRIKFTIDSSKIDAELIWIPITTFFTATQAEEIFAEFDSDDDFDRGAFTKADGSTQLFADCELFDDSESLGNYHVSRDGWVIASGVDTDYYFYYDKDAEHNTTYISKSGGVAAQSVYDDNTIAAYHMNNQVVEYTTQYEATVEPDSDGWTLGGADYASSDGDILTITTTEDVQNCYYYKVPDINFDNGFYVKFRFKLTSAKADAYPSHIYIRDGTQDEETTIHIGIDSILYRNSSGTHTDTGFSGDTDDDYHIYEIYVKGTTAKLYHDGSLIQSWTIFSTSVSDSIYFGEIANTGYGVLLFDYFYYALDVDTNPLLILDSTSNANHGTKKGTDEPVEAAGKVGQAQDFAGDDDYIDTTLATADFPTDGDYTIEFCLQADNTSTNQSFVSDWEDGDRSILLRFTSDEIDFYVGSGTATLSPNAEFAYTDTTNYHYIAATHDVSENGLELFDNGTSQDTATYVGTVGTSNNNIFLGSSADLSNPLNAREDEVRFSSTIRPDAWIKVTYNSLWDTLLTYGSEETEAVTNVLFMFTNF